MSTQPRSSSRRQSGEKSEAYIHPDSDSSSSEDSHDQEDEIRFEGIRRSSTPPTSATGSTKATPSSSKRTDSSRNSSSNVSDGNNKEATETSQGRYMRFCFEQLARWRYTIQSIRNWTGGCLNPWQTTVHSLARRISLTKIRSTQHSWQRE